MIALSVLVRGAPGEGDREPTRQDSHLADEGTFAQVGVKHRFRPAGPAGGDPRQGSVVTSDPNGLWSALLKRAFQLLGRSVALLEAALDPPLASQAACL